MPPKTFLVTINGTAVFKGDLMFSAFHNEPFFADSIDVDDEGDVYFCWKGGSAHIKSCVPYPLRAPCYEDVLAKLTKQSEVIEVIDLVHVIPGFHKGHNQLNHSQYTNMQENWKAGKLVEAIKLLRTITGVGLKEAKDACFEMFDKKD